MKRSPSGADARLNEYIHVYREMVNPDLCDDIVKLTKDSDYWASAVIGSKAKVDQSTRNCSGFDVSSCAMDGIEPYVTIDSWLFGCATEVIQTYITSHPNLKITKDTGYSLLRYETGQFYIQHTDSFTEEQRQVTASIILNSDYEGGEFAFFDRQLKYKLNRGDVIVFPSNFMFPHEVMPVTSGTRYAVVTWYV